MGVYLSTPSTDKFSTDKCLSQYSYGASSMQGWRKSQEDAHSTCPDFDPNTNTSLFAVYDGHGGSEVAEYSAIHLPEFIKNTDLYQKNDLRAALIGAFLDFDKNIISDEAQKELVALAQLDGDESEDDNEAALLNEEATMPLEDVLKKYGGVEELPPSVREIYKKNERFQHKTESSAQRGKKGGGEAASGLGDIKVRLDSKLSNGHLAKDEVKIINSGEADTTDTSTSVESKSDQNHVLSTKDGSDKQDIETGPSSSTSSSLRADSCKTEKCSSTAWKIVSSCEAQSTEENADCNDTAPNNATVDSSSGTDRPGDGGCGDDGGVGGGGSSSVSSTSVNSNSLGASSQKSENTSVSSSSSLEAAASEDDGEPSSSTNLTCKCDQIVDQGSDSNLDSEEETSEEDQYTTTEDESSDEDDEVDEPEEEEEEGKEAMSEIINDEKPGYDSGCTAILALLRDRQLYVANAGDSRCVLCRDGQAVELSVDHKPEDELELARIKHAGGMVSWDGRVNGGLNLSRALGDHCYKKNEELELKEQMISGLPDIEIVTLRDDDEFIILACDGIWNSMTSQEVVDFVNVRLTKGVDKLSLICEELFDYCLAPNTNGDGTGCDNMTALIVQFRWNGKTHKTVKRPASVCEEQTDDQLTSEAKKPRLSTDGD